MTDTALSRIATQPVVSHAEMANAIRFLTIDAVEYVGGAEMVFSLRKSAARVPSTSSLPIAAGLRSR